ncbi:hypothetical protein AWE51_02805 [Aquimarina aggregata]|uniref:Signal transduction histidine kinase internal region domain-containing protein n=1 Tax=Aquimarina aggregata TaxID=1642818 RepID=A0A162DLY0_9FLAO|nr:histidine kinase [Aquimarina aggregata]KZS42388.1 hypothetical protein AWE51_02805 [Aquimarina aggregata]
MKLKKEWLYHIAIALVLLLMGYFEDFVLGGKERLLKNFEPIYLALNVTFYISSIVIYFLNFRITCPKYLKKESILQFGIALLVLILLFAGVRYFLQEIVLFQFTGMHNYYEDSRKLSYYVFDNSYYAISTILYSTLIYLTIKFIEEKDHSRAELDLLKSQISPHFLFNTLNAFYVELIEDKPNTAKDIHRLSELLRYVTYESQQDFVSLENEIIFLKDYIHFFEKRYEDELSVSFSLKGEVTGQQIPSLILIHFVENLFKHGVINDKEAPAQIEINITKKSLELTTKNKMTSSDKHMESGIGTKNIQKRLTTLFNGNYSLNYTTNHPYFSTYLKIPL